MVNTKRIPRRALQLDSTDHALAEIDSMELAQRNGTLRVLGNWTDRLRRAFGRLAAAEPVVFESPAYGPMRQGDCVRLQLRLAELHLSFLSLGDRTA